MVDCVVKDEAHLSRESVAHGSDDWEVSLTVDPAATETVAVAAVLMLQTMSGESADVTGLLFTGWRIAVVLVVLPVISVCQMSTKEPQYDRSKITTFMITIGLTVGRGLLSQESCESDGRCELHGGDRCALSIAGGPVGRFIGFWEAWRP